MHSQKNKYWNKLIFSKSDHGTSIWKPWRSVWTTHLAPYYHAYIYYGNSQIHFTVSSIPDIQTSITRITTGFLSLKDNVDALYEYMWEPASHAVNTPIVLPDEPRTILGHVKQDMKLNPRLKLLQDPDKISGLTILWCE